MKNLWNTEVLIDQMITTMDASKEGMAILNDNGEYIHINKAHLDIYGYTNRDQILNESWTMFYPEDQLKKINQDVLPILFSDFYWKGELIGIKANGTRFPQEITLTKVENGLICVVRDITERKKAEDQLKDTIQELKNINFALDQSSIVAITDNQGRITLANNKFCEISKYSHNELLGQDHRILNSGYHPRSFFKDMWKTIGNGKVWKGEIKNRAKDGSLYWVSTTIIPFLGDNDKPYQYIAIRNDITDRKLAEEKVKYLAYYDTLTDLPNRISFNTLLQSSIENEHSAAILFLDLDRFKTINDTFGHTFGDLLLKQAGSRLKKFLGEKTVISRYGGDEFIVIINDANKHDADNIAKQIIHEFSYPFIQNEREIFITPSIGISLFPNHGKSVEELIKNADIAMYEAKNIGKNNYQFYTPELSDHNSKKIELENELRRAVEREQLHLYYQPQLDLKTGKLSGVEALMRWIHPKLGFISPAEFIPLAEESGLILSIGDWVLESACKQAKHWVDQGLSKLNVAVNISAIQFQNENKFVEKVAETLEKTKLPRGILEIEITESVLHNPSKSQLIISDLRALGTKISIDDFGTGYSSLSVLKHLSIDHLKIDKSFVDDIGTTKEPIVKSIIDMAHNLNFKVIAEGIENREQKDFLKANHCEYGQGYFYSKPLPVKEIEILLGNR